MSEHFPMIEEIVQFAAVTPDGNHGYGVRAEFTYPLTDPRAWNDSHREIELRANSAKSKAAAIGVELDPEIAVQRVTVVRHDYVYED